MPPPDLTKWSACTSWTPSLSWNLWRSFEPCKPQTKPIKLPRRIKYDKVDLQSKCRNKLQLQKISPGSSPIDCWCLISTRPSLPSTKELAPNRTSIKLWNWVPMCLWDPLPLRISSDLIPVYSSWKCCTEISGIQNTVHAHYWPITWMQDIMVWNPVEVFTTTRRNDDSSQFTI